MDTQSMGPAEKSTARLPRTRRVEVVSGLLAIGLGLVSTGASAQQCTVTVGRVEPITGPAGRHGAAGHLDRRPEDEGRSTRPAA